MHDEYDHLRESADAVVWGGRIRTARKEHGCARQAYYDRLTRRGLEVRDYYRATHCPHGGVIRAGEPYAETEGDDEFHPTRQHTDCLEWVAPKTVPA